jgi:hypothetical protein
MEMKEYLYDPSEIFKGQPKQVAFCVTYKERFVEDSFVNPNPQTCVGENANYYVGRENALEDFKNIPRYTNRDYFDVKLWERGENDTAVRIK